MPELALGFSFGFVATLLLTLLFVYLLNARNSSSKIQTLQSNLDKVQMYWSCSDGLIKAGSRQDFARDQKKSLKSAVLMGVLFCFLSWLGFILLLLMMVSMRFLAVSRFETKVFSSPLSQQNISSPDEIRQLIPQN